MTEATLPRKGGSRKKSSFYHVRWNTVGLNEERAAEVLGVSVEQIKEWDKDGNELAERFLLLWDKKHIGIPGWEGFIFTQGKLKHKNRYWTPESLIHEHTLRLAAHRNNYSLIDTTTSFLKVIK